MHPLNAKEEGIKPMRYTRALAEQNRVVCDGFLEDIESDAIEVAYTGFWTRQIFSKDKDALEQAMRDLACSFSFASKQIFIDNGFGYEIELPRIIID
jgi:hypothetical protein